MALAVRELVVTDRDRAAVLQAPVGLVGVVQIRVGLADQIRVVRVGAEGLQVVGRGRVAAPPAVVLALAGQAVVNRAEVALLVTAVQVVRVAGRAGVRAIGAGLEVVAVQERLQVVRVGCQATDLRQGQVALQQIAVVHRLPVAVCLVRFSPVGTHRLARAIQVEALPVVAMPRPVR